MSYVSKGEKSREDKEGGERTTTNGTEGWELVDELITYLITYLVGWLVS